MEDRRNQGNAPARPRAVRWVVRFAIGMLAGVGMLLCLSLLHGPAASAATLPPAPLPSTGVGTPSGTSAAPLADAVQAPLSAVGGGLATVPAPIAQPVEQVTAATVTALAPVVAPVAAAVQGAGAAVSPIPAAGTTPVSTATTPPLPTVAVTAPLRTPVTPAPAPVGVRAPATPSVPRAATPPPDPTPTPGPPSVPDGPAVPAAPTAAAPAPGTGSPLLTIVVTAAPPARDAWSGALHLAQVTPSFHLACSPVERPG